MMKTQAMLPSRKQGTTNRFFLFFVASALLGSALPGCPNDGLANGTVYTSDQANSYGPTETTTLESAKARFTIDNIKLWLSTDAGDPQVKVPPEKALPRQ